MRSRLASVAGGVAAFALIMGGAVALGRTAEAYTGVGPGGAPSWVAGDTARKGSLDIYDGTGAKITGGSDIQAVGVAGAAQGYLVVNGGAAGSGATRTNAVLAAPDPANAIPGNWSTNNITPLNFLYSATPPAGIPVGPYLRMNALGAAFQDLASGVVLYTGANAEYKNVLEVRVRDNVDTTHYWAVDIEFNPTTAVSAYDGLAPGAWKVVYPIPVVSTTPTTTTTPTANPAGAQSYGTSITFSTTVEPASGSINGGTVQFFDGATQVGADKALSGTATPGSAVTVSSDATSTLSVGSHSITAKYIPADSNYAGSTSSALSVSINGISTSASAPTPSLASPQTAGTSVTFSTDIAPASGTLSAGSVKFFDGSTQIGATKSMSGPATSGAPVVVTSDATSSLTVGSHMITAEFTSTTAGYGGVTSAATTFVVDPAPAATTSTSLVASPAATADTSTDVSLTATVSNLSVPATMPTGTVSFKDGATTLPGGTAVALNAAGTAVLVVGKSTLTLGAHNFTAVYNPNTGFTTSTSSAIPFTITLALPANFSKPSAGAARVGVASTCNPGGWTYAGIFTYTWWQRANAASAWTAFASTASTAALPASYAAHQVKCQVVAYNPVGASVSAESAPVSVTLGAASRAVVRSRIIGKVKVGVALTAYRGVWTPAPTRYLYVWKIGTTVVSRTTKFRPAAKYKGKYLVLTVSALRTGYLTGVSTTARVRIA